MKLALCWLFILLNIGLCIPKVVIADEQKVGKKTATAPNLVRLITDFVRLLRTPHLPRI